MCGPHEYWNWNRPGNSWIVLLVSIGQAARFHRLPYLSHKRSFWLGWSKFIVLRERSRGFPEIQYWVSKNVEWIRKSPALDSMKLYGHRYLWANKKYSPSIKLWLKNTPKCESNTFFLQIQNLARIRQFECEAASRPWLLRRSDVDGPYWFLEPSSFLDFVTASWKLAQLVCSCFSSGCLWRGFQTPRAPFHEAARLINQSKASIHWWNKKTWSQPSYFQLRRPTSAIKNTNAKLRFPEKK